MQLARFRRHEVIETRSDKWAAVCSVFRQLKPVEITMKRRQFRVNPFSFAAEVLEDRALLSSTGPAGAVTLQINSAAMTAEHPMQTAAHSDILTQLSSITPVTASTIPSNGDLNPYGAAFVPEGFAGGGKLNPGDLLVSNFNNGPANLQGFGTTIVRVTPSGQTSTFFQGDTHLGLTTALGVLRRGFVIVGNMPTTDGTGATAQQGSLLILDKNGNLVRTLTDNKLLDGPWDMTINDQGGFAQLFVSNVLTGTVTRIDLLVPMNGSPKVVSETQIASGYAHRTDPAALVLGPTGLAFDAKTDTLFVASTADNKIFAIHNAAFTQRDHGTGNVIYQDAQHLHGPIAMVLAPNGDLIVANGDAVNADPNQPSELVEFTQHGKFVSQFQLDPNPDAAFGIAFDVSDGQVRFAAVNDNQNTVSIWTLSH
jgi:sugar lactone lactonase YvrE